MALLYLIRLAFASLASFDFLNSIQVLKFPLHFPWLSLAALSLFIWFLWEKFVKARTDSPFLVGGLFLLQLYGDTMGNLFHLYAKFSWFDRLLHFTGGAVLGTAAFLMLSHLNKKRCWNLNYRYLIVFAISLAVFFGVVYEFFEFFITYTLKFDMITDRFDTDRDLLLDTIGAAFGIGFAALYQRRKSLSA